MSDEQTPREGEMWFCPHCPIWVGSRLEDCKRGHRPPHWEIRSGDVPFSRADNVSYSPRLLQLYWKLKGRVRQFRQNREL